MESNALKINPADNVAIAIRQIKKYEDVIVDGVMVCRALEDIPASHKVALTPINKGTPVIRYGEPIVIAVEDIASGRWVHVHNTKPTDHT
jgi:altronate dehydratase